MPSNGCVWRIGLTNVPNAGDTAFSGGTTTIDALYIAFNGTTTIVTPATYAYAGNASNRLFPARVGVTTAIGLCPSWIACNTFPCTLPKDAPLRIIHCNSAWASTRRNHTYPSDHQSSVSLLNRHRFRFVPPRGADSPDGNPKNRCQSTLIARNCRRQLVVGPANSGTSRPYTAPAACGEFVACSFAMAAVVLSCNHSPSSSSFSPYVALDDPLRSQRRLMAMAMAMAMCRYVAMLIDWPSPASLIRSISCFIRSVAHFRPSASAGHH